MIKPIMYDFPIVGRDEILEVFQEMLEDGLFLTHDINLDDVGRIHEYQSCLLIRGEAQMGKTRLLNELFHISLKNKKISTLRLTLSMRDLKVGYGCSILFCLA